MEIKEIAITELKPYENNPRKNDDAVDAVKKSIETFGFKVPLVIDKNNVIVAGHTRYKAAQSLGLEKVPCIVADDLSDEQLKAFRLADNKTAELATWDFDKLADELLEISKFDEEIFNVDMSNFGFNIDMPDFGFDTKASENTDVLKNKISERFLFSPFSVLSARTKEWQNRKKFWIQRVGIRSSQSRENAKITGAFSSSVPKYYNFKADCEKKLGRELSNKDFEENYLRKYLKPESIITNTNTGAFLSIFDPVLCELMYYWFCPTAGKVLDPFAGGNVRGIIATLLGYEYTGIDLRQEQIDVNLKSFYDIFEKYSVPIPKWICGDSMEIDSLVNEEYDMIFSCPPYFDLEIYDENNPKDISNMSYEKFLECYYSIIKKSASMLKNNRFAVFVVGDVRDKKTGMYRNFVSETISAFNSAGLHLYNEMILVQQIGSAALRVGRQFTRRRKVCKTHQNVLCFYKGDNQKEILNDFKEVNIALKEMEEDNNFLPIP